VERHSKDSVEVATGDERVISLVIPRFELVPTRLFSHPL
jgi:hypothetical protein